MMKENEYHRAMQLGLRKYADINTLMLDDLDHWMQIARGQLFGSQIRDTGFSPRYCSPEYSSRDATKILRKVYVQSVVLGNDTFTLRWA